MIEMVNGFVCTTSADVSDARRGLNPENVTGDPAKQEQLDSRAGRAITPAVVLGGSLASADQASDVPAVDVARPSRNGAMPAPALRLFDLSV